MYYNEAEDWMCDNIGAFCARNGWHSTFYEGYAYTDGYEKFGEDYATMRIFNLKHEIVVTYWTKHNDFEIEIDGNEPEVEISKEEIVGKVKEIISKFDSLAA